MQIFVQSFLNSARILTIEIEPFDSIESLKAKIQDEDGISTDLMKLYFNGELLEEGRTLSDYNIQQNSYINTSNTISTLATRELRQKAKLDLAVAKRGEEYDINKLPTKYSGNAVVDNANAGGLQERRPWLIDYTIVTISLELFLDPNDADSYPGTGTDYFDLSTNRFTTTLVGAPAYNNTHFTFDGTTEYIDTNKALTSESFSVGVWFRTSAPGVNMILSKEGPAGTPWNYRLWLNNGTINGDIAQPGNIDTISSPLSNYNNGEWYLVMFTRDDTILRLYVNGVEVKNQADDYTGGITNLQELWIGRSAFTSGGSSPTGSYQYTGDIGQVFIYDSVLSPAEILQNYNVTKVKYGL
jgi:small subunit ribosomal protein S27Ae